MPARHADASFDAHEIASNGGQPTRSIWLIPSSAVQPGSSRSVALQPPRVDTTSSIKPSSGRSYAR